MKQILFLTAFLLCTSFSSVQKMPVSRGTEKVYVTKSGKRYHRHDCKYVKGKNGIRELTLKQASERHYTPCKVCKPPVYAGSN